MMEILIFLVVAHWVCDYPLQGEFLATAKQKGPLRFYHLVAHGGIQAGGVLLVTGSVGLALVECFLHTFIDELKVKGKTSFAVDQFLHILCKLAYVVYLGGMVP